MSLRQEAFGSLPAPKGRLHLHKGPPVDTDTAAISDLFARFLIAGHSLREALQFVARTACDALPDAAAAAVSLVEKRESTVEVYSPGGLEVGELHLADRPGPCQQASEDFTTELIPSMLSEKRWPEFTNLALYGGLQSALVCPLRLRDGDVGSLGFYSFRKYAFAPHAVALGESVADRASVLVTNVKAYETAATLARQLKEALQSRAVIDQAKGIVMARNKVSADEAFEMLKKLSQHSNVKVREISQQIVQSIPSDTSRPTH